MTNQDKLVIFITGATVGLGRLAAKKCLDLGHTVIITGRSEEKLTAAREWILKDSPEFESNLYSVEFDLTDIKSVKTAVEKFETFGLTAIDVLVNNAGGALPEFQQVNGEIEKTIYMNAVTPIYLTELLLPYIKKSKQPKKRILFVGSSLHDRKTRGGGGPEAKLIPEDVSMRDIASSPELWESMRYYKLSKLACVWDTYEFAAQNPDIVVSCFCPGFVPTTELARNSSFFLKLLMKYVISRFSFTTSEEQSTDEYVYYITTPDIQTATYYQKKEVSTSSDESLNETKRKAYWELATKTINALK